MCDAFSPEFYPFRVLFWSAAAWQPFAHPRKIPLRGVRTWVMAALCLSGSDRSRRMPRRFSQTHTRLLFTFTFLWDSSLGPKRHGQKRGRCIKSERFDLNKSSVSQTVLCPPQLQATLTLTLSGIPNQESVKGFLTLWPSLKTRC